MLTHLWEPLNGMHSGVSVAHVLYSKASLNCQFKLNLLLMYVLAQQLSTEGRKEIGPHVEDDQNKIM